jgi:omega-amidase
MIERAAEKKADLVALPELFYLPYELSLIKKTGDMGRLLSRFSLSARKNNIFICPGSLAIKTDSGLQNRSFLIGPAGEILISYSKCHLFDARLKNIKASESAVFTPGNEVVAAKTGLCSIGIQICYDIRFPELARMLALQGTELLLVPAVFNAVTGAAHWHLLHRARAIENQMFVAAVSQARTGHSPFVAYGHSMVISPWGEILAEAGEREETIFADIDPKVLENTRRQMPVFSHRRRDLYKC